MTIDDLHWHDGNFRRVTLTMAGEGEDCVMGAVLEVELYPSADAAERKPIRIEFDALRDCTLSADFRVLADNAFAGNIGYCNVDHPDPSTICARLHLADGYLKVVAGTARIGS